MPEFLSTQRLLSVLKSIRFSNYVPPTQIPERATVPPAGAYFPEKPTAELPSIKETATSVYTALVPMVANTVVRAYPSDNQRARSTLILASFAGLPEGANVAPVYVGSEQVSVGNGIPILAGGVLVIQTKNPYYIGMLGAAGDNCRVLCELY